MARPDVRDLQLALLKAIGIPDGVLTRGLTLDFPLREPPVAHVQILLTDVEQVLEVLCHYRLVVEAIDVEAPVDLLVASEPAGD